MKHLILLIFLSFSVMAAAQTTENEKAIQQQQIHIPASKSIVGIWRQTGITNPNNGKFYNVKSGNHKVVNPNGTFYTFVTWGTERTTVVQYGNYEITSDSTLVEHIVEHGKTPELDGKDCAIRYKFIDDNTIIMAWSFDGKKWVGERWNRVPMSKAKQSDSTEFSSMTGKTRTIPKPDA